MTTEKNILVSIIVASYNYGRYLRENLESLKNQTYTNIEIIVVDDGSTDNSIEIINEYVETDKRFKLIIHDNHSNLGLNKSLKKALEYCNGDYIAFCESDDYWAPNHVEEKVNYINKHPNAGIVVCDFIPFGTDKKSINTYTNSQGLIKLYNYLKNLKSPQIIFFDVLKYWTFPTFSIVMVKASELKQCDFDAPVKCGTDIWLWRQLMIKTRTGYVDKKLTYFRRSGESLVSD